MKWSGSVEQESKRKMTALPTFKKSKKFLISALFFIGLLFGNCAWESNYKNAAKLSLQSDTDLILVPYPYYIFDRESEDVATISHYSTEEIQNILVDHGLSWQELKSNWNLDDSHSEFEKSVKYTSHYTQYSYDTDIPIWIYGPKWIHSGIYSDKIHQQHIPSIYSKILNYNFQNKLNLDSLEKLFKDSSDKPEIIVTIVVDQGGHQLYKSHPLSFPFLKNLKRTSAYFKNAKVGHLEAHTAVGHTAIGTGAYPRESKVFSNEVYLVTNGKLVPKPVFLGADKKLNISELKTLSLADEWDLENDNKPVIVSQCYAARASIGMAGHGAKIPSELAKGSTGDFDYVYWQDKNSLSWNTQLDNFSLPKSTSKYSLYPFYLERTSKINTHFQADNLIEFRVKLHQFQSSEFQVRMDGELFRDVVEETIINSGKAFDGHTDLAYVTLKATDAVGHMYGWESEEANKILKATDDEIERIFNFLKSKYDDRFIMLVTADHGAAPMPEISNGLFLTQDRFLLEVNSLLPENQRETQSIVKWITHSQLSLDKDLMEKHSISVEDVISKIKNITLNGKPFFRRVWTKKQIE